MDNYGELAAPYGDGAGDMNRYQLYLLQQGSIVARHEFTVEDDEHACEATALVFDACADRCDDFELWDGVRLVTRCARWQAHTRSSHARRK